MIRGWRVRSEGPGYVCYFDPSVEHVVLYDGLDLAYEVREGREASEARDSSAGLSIIDGCGILPQLPLFARGLDE